MSFRLRRRGLACALSVSTVVGLAGAAPAAGRECVTLLGTDPAGDQAYQLPAENTDLLSVSFITTPPNRRFIEFEMAGLAEPGANVAMWRHFHLSFQPEVEYPGHLHYLQARLNQAGHEFVWGEFTSPGAAFLQQHGRTAGAMTFAAPGRIRIEFPAEALPTDDVELIGVFVLPGHTRPEVPTLGEPVLPGEYLDFLRFDRNRRFAIPACEAAQPAPLPGALPPLPVFSQAPAQQTARPSSPLRLARRAVLHGRTVRFELEALSRISGLRVTLRNRSRRFIAQRRVGAVRRGRHQLLLPVGSRRVRPDRYRVELSGRSAGRSIRETVIVTIARRGGR